MSRLFFLVLLFFAAPCFAGSLQLSPVPEKALQQLNNGHVLEALSILDDYLKDNPDDVQGLFLLAQAKTRILFMSSHTDSDVKKVLDLLTKVEGLCSEKLKTDIEAQFFYGAAQGIRAQLTGMENEWWDTAQLGKKMKRSANAVIEKDPDFNEAYYLLGSYNYFADALPGYVKFLRTLMFLPGGDREGGLKQLEIAKEKGHFVSVEAARTLALIYTYYEDAPDMGIDECDGVLAHNPDSYDIGLYKGINLYFDSSFKKSEEHLQQLHKEILGYSKKQKLEPDQVLTPIYLNVDREARYWTARSLMQQGKMEDAQELLMQLKTPEIHQPYWIMRGVYLSIAQIDYINGNDKEANELIDKIIQWQDVKGSRDKARLLKKKHGKIGAFDIDFH